MLDTIYNLLPVSERLVTAGQPDADELHAIGRAGFEVVINLGLAGTDYAVADEGEILAGYGVEYHHLPVSFEDPRIADFQRFAQRFSQLGERRVFLHCAANKRVSVFLALHRILNEAWPAEAAMAEVHRIWTPDPVWQGFIQRVLAELRSG